MKRLRTTVAIVSAAACSFLVTMRASAQVYSMGIYSAGMTYYGDHCIGSPSCRFGYCEYSYETDTNGYTIWFSPDRLPQPGDTFHKKTWVYLGPFSISVPMRPWSIFLAGNVMLLMALALGNLGWMSLKKRRYGTDT
jgi:hypothetical protein